MATRPNASAARDPWPFPDHYADECPAVPESDFFEPSDEDWAEADRIHNAMLCERFLGIDLAPTTADSEWWADQQDTRDAREAAEDAIDRADREACELAEVDRLTRERRYDVAERRGVGPGHAAEGGAW